MVLRSCAIAVAALALSACVSHSYAGSRDNHPRYPRTAFGYVAYVETQGGDGHRAASGVACDRARDICYDRYGISYHATARYLGEREANRAYKHYGDQVFLFSPRRGVICDRRTDSCSRLHWGHDGYGNTGYRPWLERGIAGPAWHPQSQQGQYWPPHSWSDD